MENKNNILATEQELRELGFEKVAEDLCKMREFERKCAIAYEHFARRVSQEQINQFNQKLRAKSIRETDTDYYYDQLVFTDISKYQTIPPSDVLMKLKEAQKFNVFDYFEIAHIQSQQERKDPILFGCINGCPDRFFISQWDSDIKIEDLLSAEEVNIKIDGIQIP